jgi:cytochrome d ubiquinol oxidase subunit I
MTGGMVTEMGRQPWIIYNIMEVSEGISDVPLNQIWFSIISIIFFYIILFIMDYVLTISRIRKGFDDSEYIGGTTNE